MKELHIQDGKFACYSSRTMEGHFPATFSLYLESPYSNAGYGKVMAQMKLSDINKLIDLLIKYRDEVDHEQAVESGDMNVAVS